MLKEIGMKKWIRHNATRLAVVGLGNLVISVACINTLGWPSVVIMAALDVAAYFYVCHVIDEIDAGYGRRIDADESIHWDVILNGVPIGLLRDAEYARIQQAVLRDRRILVNQVGNVASTLLSAVLYACRWVPVWLFWAYVGLATFEPGALATLVNQLQAAPSAAQELAGVVLPLAGFTWVVAIVLMTAFGVNWGFVNCYSAAIARLVCQRLNAPSLGRVALTRASPLNAPAHG